MDQRPRRARLHLGRQRKVMIALGAIIALVLSGLGIQSASASTRSRLAVSLNPDRSNAARLDGSTVKGEIYVFVRNSRSLDKVDFYLDGSWRTKPPIRTEMDPPFDFVGADSDGTALPYDTTKLDDGSHSIRVRLTWSDGSRSSRRANFTVANHGLTTTPTSSPTKTTTTAPAPAATTSASSTTSAPTRTTAPPTTSAPTTTKAAPTTTASGLPTTSTTTLPAPNGSWPSSPPAKICGNTSLLSGPATAPAGAIIVPAGDNSSLDLGQAGKTYWFAPGVHTLGAGQYDQIIPSDNSTYIGGPGAILDGQGKN